MNILKQRICLTAACLMALTGLAHAGGFSIYEAGAKATGMGCAVTASVDDGSAMFYNIAAISFMPGSVVDLNVMPVAPAFKYRQAAPPTESAYGETVSQSFIIPGFGITHNFKNNNFGIGLGVSAPFGLGVEWQNPTTWVGRFTNYDVDLATVYVTPAVSWQPLSNLSVALGADFAYQHIQLNRYTPQEFGAGTDPYINAVDTKLDGTAELNVTPCIGAMYKPTEKLSIGVMYHHEKTMKYRDQEATLTNVAPDALVDTVDDVLDYYAGEEGLRTFSADTDLGLPHMLSLGVAYRFTPRFLMEFDAVHFGWSNFDQLDLKFSPDPTGSLSSVIHERYEDRWQYRLGADFNATPKLKVLAGFAYDKTPQPVESMSPLLPDASRKDYSIGLQYLTGKWRFTGSYMAVINDARGNVVDGEAAMFEEEANDPDAAALKTFEAGNYEAVANIWAVGVGYHF